MRVTVLGKSPAWQDAGGACSGYLVEEGETRLLVDCGSGVFAKLRSHVDYLDVDAAVITHMHADHFADLLPYSYALLLTYRQQPVPVAGYEGTDDPVRPRLILPAGGPPALGTICGLFGDERLVEEGFRMEGYDQASEVEVGPLALRFVEVPHYVLTYAIEVTAASGQRVVFGADCAPNDAIVEFARDVDLLFIEATLPRPERAGARGHLTPGEAGEHARRANAKRVVLTHFSDELDAGWIKSEGEQALGGPLELAAGGAVFEL
ncbi:MBL fold metallo-hydrolase [soil metagenome]